ncbi:MAG: hypothetical protein K2O14_02865 [Oscillospiraceae bacterium]|nr:hypothetical protein [Oscillospiraceae bacterium]
MKGKATLTLCDAATGKVVKRLEESNMVTNAISRLFNPPQEAIIDTNWSGQIKAMLPMWKNVLGGIILLGNTLEESKDNIMLHEDCVPVGTAGDAYSGANVMRGSLNINESYETENGYHFTWDFPTDKCNGTIRSIALTSRAFGNAGFASCEDHTGSLVINPYEFNYCYILSSAPKFMTLVGNYFIGSFKPNELLFASSSATTTKTKVVFNRYRTLDAKGLKINDRVSGSEGADVPIETKELELEYKVDNLKNIFYNPQNGDLYIFAPASHSTLSGSTYPYRGTVRYWRIDPDTLTIKEFSSVRFPKSGVGAVLSSAIYDGVFYAVTENEGTYKVNIAAGTLTEVLPYCSKYPSRFYVNDTGLMYDYYDSVNGMGCYRRMDVDTGFFYHGLAFGVPVPCDRIPQPYSLFAYGQEFNTAFVLLLSNYLATVNNLSQPLTKTNAHTLKISYDIINA